MLFYHATSATAAEAILKEGFKNNQIANATALVIPEGVHFSDYPLDINSGTKGNVTLVIEMPEEKIAENYELVYEDWCPYREFIIPAEIINAYGLPRLCTKNEVEQAVEAAKERLQRELDLPREVEQDNRFPPPLC